MIDPVTLHRLGFAALFLLLSAFAIFFRMLPVGPISGAWPPPDMIVLLGFAWVLRRPDFVPVLLFAALMLTSELLFLSPPGPATALAVVGLEALRARAGLMREQTFPLEWATVAAVLVLMMLAERALMAVFFVRQAPFGLTLLELVVNIAAYPVVVGVSAWAFRVRRLAPGEHAAEARLV
jgi:rod shape-determining protein MreD